MHTYVFKGINFTIDTAGFFTHTDELDFTVHEQTADKVHTTTIYPNGVSLEVEQTADKVIIRTNHRLIVGPTGNIIFEGIEY